jgi:hypothetical protein
VCSLAFAAPLAHRLDAQENARATREAPFARAADGKVLGTLRNGAEVAAGTTRAGWTRVTVEGWMVDASLGRDVRDGFQFGVSAPRGENLRAEPNGRVLARLRYGTLVERIGARGSWVKVRRTGWVPRRSVEREVETAAVSRRTGTGERREERADPAGSRQPRAEAVGTRRTSNDSAAVGDSAGAAPADASGRQLPGASRSRPSEEPRIQVTRSTALHAAPDAAELGSLQPGLNGRVLGRAGEWVRVQIEGWVRSGDVGPPSDGAMVGVSAAELRAEPARYVGQLVEWRLQFIAVQEADELRSELPAGQPFLLTRGPLPEPGFVYVILPRGQAEQFRVLPALQELVVHVRIKAPRTKYLTTPVVELVTAVSGLPGK